MTAALTQIKTGREFRRRLAPADLHAEVPRVFRQGCGCPARQERRPKRPTSAVRTSGPSTCRRLSERLARDLEQGEAERAPGRAR